MLMLKATRSADFLRLYNSISVLYSVLCNSKYALGRHVSLHDLLFVSSAEMSYGGFDNTKV